MSKDCPDHLLSWLTTVYWYWTFQQVWHPPTAQVMVAAVQLELLQSVGTRHIRLGSHPYMGAHEPPQSMSVSLLFFTPSVQLGTAQVLVVVPVHTPLTQSPATAQVFPFAHFEHIGPPQLRSVSMPFLTASSQAGTAHNPPVHTPLVQSPPFT